jgi:hypothetical protein
MPQLVPARPTEPQFHFSQQARNGITTMADVMELQLPLSPARVRGSASPGKLVLCCPAAVPGGGCSFYGASRHACTPACVGTGTGGDDVMDWGADGAGDQAPVDSCGAGAALEGEQPGGEEEEGDDVEFETDPKRLQARQKQIDFGKNTIGYERYVQAVPRCVPCVVVLPFKATAPPCRVRHAACWLWPASLLCQGQGNAVS